MPIIVSHSQIALTKKGYSANSAWKPLTDPGDNADENAAGSPDVKRDPLPSSCSDFRSLTNNPCVSHIEVYQGNKSYTRHVCKNHSLLCPGFTCEAQYCLITDLNKSVECGCRCSGCERSGSGRKLKLKREEAF